MQHSNAPYAKRINVCKTCCHTKECRTFQKTNDPIYGCDYHETEEEQRLQKQREEDLRWVANTVQGARLYQDQINTGMIYFKKIFTGNSGAYYNLGMRDRDLSLLDALMYVLDLETPGQVHVFLENKIKQGV